MRSATVHKLPIPAKLRCEGCGTLADAACDCGVSYVPVKPAVAAAKAVAANPHKSDRAIAAEIGVDHKTVSKARHRTVGEKSPTQKRTGADGRSYNATKPKRTAVSVERWTDGEFLVLEGERIAKKRSEFVRRKVDGVMQVSMRAPEDQWKPLVPGIRITTGGTDCARHDITVERIEPQAERADLPSSAQQRLEAHKRKVERELRAEHEQRMRGLDEEVRQRVVERLRVRNAELDAAMAEIESERRSFANMRNSSQPIFTPSQFSTILMCLHPDGERTSEKLHEAFLLFNSMKLQLSGKR